MLAIVIPGAAACDRKPAPSAPETVSPQDPAGKPDKEGVTFGAGFHKEEAGATATFRWVRRDASLHINAPTEGRYQLTFRPFTVFSTVENTVAVSVSGQLAGSFSTRAYDVPNSAPVAVTVPLHAGDNPVELSSQGAEHRMSDSDDRQVAYGLMMPLKVERAP